MDATEQKFAIRMSHCLLVTGPDPYIVTVVERFTEKELFSFHRSSLESAVQLFKDLERIFSTIRAIVQYPKEQ